MTTQADISAEIALLSQEYAIAGVVETDVRVDYPPYRSSLLRHPTKSPVQVDPEGVEPWSPVFGERDHRQHVVGGAAVRGLAMVALLVRDFPRP